MKELKITITTLSPVVLTTKSNAGVMTETNDYFTGTVVRGALAARYIRTQKLGSNAHEDKGFMDIFYGGLRFVSAYPVVNGKRAIPMPASLQKCKSNAPKETNTNAPKEDVIDLLLFEAGRKGDKSVKGLGVVEDNTYIPADVKKNISLHMSRNTDEERLAGRSITGGIYNYESIDAGQTFEGLIVGEQAELESLISALALKKKSFECRIGRSKFTSYGCCSIQVGAIQDIPKVTISANEIYLRLETPALVSTGIITDSTLVLKDMLAALKQNGEDFTIEKVYANFTTIDNFVGVWGLPRPTENAVAEGSVYKITKHSAWNDADIEILSHFMYGGVGTRLEEGFGQLRLWEPRHLNLSTEKSFAVQKRSTLSEEVCRVVCQILEKRVLEKVHLQAKADVESVTTDLTKMKHSFAQLENWLGSRKNSDRAKRTIQEKMAEAAERKRVMEKYLQSVMVNGNRLSEILEGKKGLPFANLTFKEEVPAELAKEVGYKVPTSQDALIYYEYWLWFFRHARKVTRRGEKD